MTPGPLTHADERFTLGVRNGFIPTVQPVSNTIATPFGLTLRTIPTPRNVVYMRAADGVLTMGTEKVTSQSTDGSDEGDTRYDVVDD
jgi:hypothetical protein